VALQLSGQLQRWPRLSAQNLHDFRKLAKQLRYVLRFSGEQTQLVDRLGEVKDAVGLWHDWLELDQIAQRLLQHSGRCAVKEEIRSHARRNFDRALHAANLLRSQYLPAGTSSLKAAEKPHDPCLKRPQSWRLEKAHTLTGAPPLVSHEDPLS